MSLECLLQFHLDGTLHAQDWETPGTLYTVVLWTGYANSALNPLLYVLHLQVRGHWLIIANFNIEHYQGCQESAC